jgi:elongation factor Ts
MSISAKDVKALRDATGAGMMDAKRALAETDGDHQAATQILREKGLAKAGERADRETDQGAVAVASANGSAAVVQLKCETDFSAKSEAFTSLLAVLADAVLADGSDAVGAHESALEDLKLSLKENIEVGTAQRIEAADGNTLDTYLHMQDGRGVNGVIVEGSGVPTPELHQVALHIAFAKPVYLSTDEISEEEVDQERLSLLEITKAEGKPEQAWDKIVDGRMRGWYGERVLLQQGLHGDKTSVQDSLGGGSIVRFVQVTIGG